MNDHGIGDLYEAIADWFDQNRNKNLVERNYLEALLQNRRPGASVLDLGCGSGEPIARFLIEQGCQVTGVDGSSNMIALCKNRFPDMEWIRADMQTLNLGRKYDAIIAWDSFFHLTHDAQRAMFSVFANHIQKDGMLLFTSGDEHGVAYGEMSGHTVYHASLASAEYHSLFERYGFEVLLHNVNDVTCGNRTVWLVKKTIGAVLTNGVE
ncbi:class I SAM-dependent DNA methyltransferase [Spirosoma validum]|uniref:Class I SAM-dependent methyltransferase n=1 Tax=Spirosoma validum TaxID=2771355 RepID=A0A927B1S4_9BACT|nr:class I SAM-dependent methyltransferase [Spirosoma validum]MBD2753996.1 class I SAM-dependent methyltransferase [Spirosoma validum]